MLHETPTRAAPTRAAPKPKRSRIDQAREDAMPTAFRKVPESERRHVDNPTGDPLAYGTEVHGDCCSPTILHGDIALLSPSTTVKAGMYVAIFPKDGSPGALKKLTFLAPPPKPGDEVRHLHRIEMSNPKRVVFLDPDTVERMHAVAGVIRDGKFTSLLEGAQ